MTTINPEVFDRAAERVERVGMVKGGYYPGWLKEDSERGYVPLHETREKIREGDLKCCSLGALIAETPDLTEFEVYADFFARALGFEDNFDIPVWNDLPSRRKRDLVKAFRKAAAKAREAA